MMILNQQTAQTLTTGGVSATATGGFFIWLQQNYSIVSLGFVAFAALVGLGSAVVSWHFQKQRNVREIEVHRKLMGDLPDKIEGTDNAPKDYVVD